MANPPPKTTQNNVNRRETRKMAREKTLAHVLHNVVECSNEKLKNCLTQNGLDSLRDIFSLANHEINALKLTWKDEVIDLDFGLRNTLRILREWHKYLVSLHGDIKFWAF